MLAQVRSTFTRWCRTFSVGSSDRAIPQVRVGTDCSGADAPIWALRAMGIPFSHIFSCDVEESAKAFIVANSSPQLLFSDMLKRPLADVPSVDVYICGFPCTPYSLLRGSRTGLLKEAAAKPYLATIRFLRHGRPRMAILENVIGLNRVMKKVVADLERLGGYRIFIMLIDSAELGEPVARPRYYFLLLRVDSIIPCNGNDIAAFVGDAVADAKRPVANRVEDLMLPNDHAIVKASLSTKRTSSRPVKPGTKWSAKHAQFKDAVGATWSDKAVSSGLTSLLSLRERDVWAGALRMGKPGLVVDVSQSIDRAHIRSNGQCGTVTPRSKICVESAGRVVIPMEKLMLHLLPIHQMKFPSISDNSLNVLGGNTMHLKAVGLVLAIGLCLLSTSSTSSLVSGVHQEPRLPAVFFGAPGKANRASVSCSGA
jgi:site-specific DNA-cytosine methylase